jgi:lipopolysaccharide/colanic/teichoic acid biosynthesis glycosyltransferase
MWPRKRESWRWRLLEEIGDSPVPMRKNGCDGRVTSAFARLCRRYSLDELPQLWHIITGEMSFVGPRPLTSQELNLYYGDEAAQVLRVKPGLTGLWQTRGRNRLSYRQRRRFDLFLVSHDTPWLRASILLRTLPCVVSGKDAW